MNWTDLIFDRISNVTTGTGMCVSRAHCVYVWFYILSYSYNNTNSRQSAHISAFWFQASDSQFPISKRISAPCTPTFLAHIDWFWNGQIGCSYHTVTQHSAHIHSLTRSRDLCFAKFRLHFSTNRIYQCCVYRCARLHILNYRILVYRGKNLYFPSSSSSFSIIRLQRAGATFTFVHAFYRW